MNLAELKETIREHCGAQDFANIIKDLAPEFHLSTRIYTPEDMLPYLTSLHAGLPALADTAQEPQMTATAKERIWENGFENVPWDDADYYTAPRAMEKFARELEGELSLWVTEVSDNYALHSYTPAPGIDLARHLSERAGQSHRLGGKTTTAMLTIGTPAEHKKALHLDS